MLLAHWENMEEKYYKRIDVWQGNSLTIAGRKWLINSILANVPTSHMSMFVLLKTVVYRLEKEMRKVFWQRGSTKKKYRLVRWNKICKSKKERWHWN